MLACKWLEVVEVPCFIKVIRMLRIPVPSEVSLTDEGDAKRIEEKLRRRLNAATHKELHGKMDYVEAENLRKMLEEVLEEVKEEKKEEYPDRFRELRRRWKEIYAHV